MASRAAPRRGRRAPEDYKSQTAPRGRPETAGAGGRLGRKCFLSPACLSGVEGPRGRAVPSLAV